MRGRQGRARPRHLAILLSAALAIGALWPATGTGVKIPNLPKVPKVTSYPVTIDAAGYLDFEWTFDNRQPCIPGIAKTVSEELSFELGRPRRTVVNAIGGAVSAPYAIGGEAKLKTKLSGYQTSNYCSPTPLAPEPPQPECKPLDGKLGVLLSPQGSNEDDGDVVPLGRGVMVSFIRKSNTMQNPSCLEGRPKARAIQEDKGVHVDALQLPGGLLTVPLANGTKFWGLKPGQRLSRTIKIGGGCETVTAQASRLSEYIKRCTIGGRIVVVIKRLK
jgi:hypothetical protein